MGCIAPSKFAGHGMPCPYEGSGDGIRKNASKMPALSISQARLTVDLGALSAKPWGVPQRKERSLTPPANGAVGFGMTT